MADPAEIQDAVHTIAEAAASGANAEAAIEAAENAQEDAEETAALLAAAAMENERGMRLAALETECATWAEKLAAAINSLRTEFMAMVETVKAQALPAASPAAAVTVAAAETASSPQSSATATVTETTTATVEPAKASAAVEPIQSVKPARKPNWL